MANYQRNTVNTIDDIRAIAIHSGSHFFDTAAMRFFNSRILTGVYHVDSRAAVTGNRFLFITSEVHGDRPRHYAVRMLTLQAVRDDRPATDIQTVGEYYASAREARAAAESLAAEMKAAA